MISFAENLTVLLWGVYSIQMSTKTFGSPRKDNKAFTAYWDSIIKDITERPNFVASHLQALEIFCDLLVEYQSLTKTLATEGLFYEAEGRYGVQKKIHPLCIQKNKVVSEIRSYCKILGISMPQIEDVEEEEKNEWLG